MTQKEKLALFMKEQEYRWVNSTIGKNKAAISKLIEKEIKKP
jgi:hypothetical protein